MHYTLHFLFVGLLCATFVSASKNKNLFYIYDWPDLVNRYANFTDRSHVHHGVEFPQWTSYYGAGRLLNKETMEHKTSQFGLFKLIYERALIDPRRTLNPDEATSFLIPYDFGMDAAFFEANGRMRRTSCPLSVEVYNRLRRSPYFNKYQGHDHTLIISINQNMNYFFGAQSCIDLTKLCWNCTKLCIDEYMFIAADRNFELKHRGINWHAIPFPSDYHYSSSSGSIAPWLQNKDRSKIVSFTGSPRRYNEHATALREALIKQCGEHPKTCIHGTYKHEGGANEYSRDSIFCLQPPGDMPTRKSLFDAILSGCIPVLFHPLTGRFMYEWHLPQETWGEIAIHFDTIQENFDLIEQRVDFIAKLVSLYNNSREIVEKKQKRLQEVAFNFQYSLIEADPSSPHQRSPAKLKDLKDAYEIAMDKVIAIHSGVDSHDRLSEYLRCKYVDGKHGIKIQTADFCNRTYTNKDPFDPPALVSVFYKGTRNIVNYENKASSVL